MAGRRRESPDVLQPIGPKQFAASQFLDFEEYWEADTYREFRELERDWPRVCQAAVRTRLGSGSLDRLVDHHNRRAAVAGAECDLTVEQWRKWVKALGNRCVYCGSEMRRALLEHVVPISRGGGTTANNVVPGCLPCNGMKGSKTPDEWLSAMDFDRFMAKIMTANSAVSL